MSLEADFRRDTNPTPTRFLLECGVFTPGFGLSLENYNPFDASMKFFHTGTPKAELNPFDSSFKSTSSSAVVQASENTSSPANCASPQPTTNERQRRHPWTDLLSDEDVAMPIPSMSPCLSPSSPSSLTSSPTPPLRSPPLQTLSLSDYNPSSTTDLYPATAAPSTTTTHVQTFDPRTFFHHLEQPTHEPFTSTEDSSHSCIRQASPSSSSTCSSSPRQTLHPCETLYTYPSHDQTRPSESHEQYPQPGHDTREESLDNSIYEEDDRDNAVEDQDSELDAAMPELEMEQLPVKTSAHQFVKKVVASRPKSTRTRSFATKAKKSEIKTTTATSNSNGKSKKDERAATTVTSNNKASKMTSSSPGRKRQTAEDETPEAKRQKFLERNRMAASKCREKKRLQTLKTISSADEITARNKELHETLDMLQEEVRHLKNQILGHRDCGCDVIQKFVKSSLGISSFPTSSSTTSTSPTMNLGPRAVNQPYHPPHPSDGPYSSYGMNASTSMGMDISMDSMHAAPSASIF